MFEDRIRNLSGSLLPGTNSPKATNKSEFNFLRLIASQTSRVYIEKTIISDIG